MPTIFVAVVHAIGEDNESNTSVVGRSREECEAKLLEFFNASTVPDEEPEIVRVADTGYETLEEAQDDYSWNIDEHEVFVSVGEAVALALRDWYSGGTKNVDRMRELLDVLVEDAIVDFQTEHVDVVSDEEVEAE